MPKQEELDQKALDYGVLLAGLEKVRKEKEKLEGEIAELTGRRDVLSKETQEGKEAHQRVRNELIELEKQLETLRKAGNDELDAEKRIVEEHRKSLSKGLEDLKKMEDTLNSRTASVEGRERLLAEAEKQVESKGRAQGAEDSRLDTLAQQLQVKENSVLTRERAVTEKESDVDRKLKDMKTAESNQKAAMEQTRIDRQQANDDMLAATAKLAEAKRYMEQNEETLRQMRLFCDVVQDARDFIASHTGNRDAIMAYLDEKLPKFTEAISNKSNVA